MCTALLPCPLCSQPFFKTLETLRIGLIKVATENLACPVCHDTFMGLDKLTIHLFSHCNDTCEAINKTEEYAAAGYQEKADEISENIGMKIEGPFSGQNFEGTTFKIDKRKDKNVALGALGKSGRKPNKAQNKMNNINDGVTNSNATIKSLPKFPIYNMNSLPFIGIPKPIRDASNSEDNSRSDANGSINQDCLSERCEICGFYFLGKNILEMHRKIIHNVQENGSAKYSCHLCSKVFKMRGSLMVHLRMVHFGMNPSVSGHHGSLSSCNEMQDVKNNNVLVEQGNNLSPFDEKIASPQDGAEIENNGNNKQWECDICRKLFTTKYFLKKHKRLHTGEMPYSCAQCNKTFTFQQSYHKHLLYHNDDKPHTCSQCGRAFKELSTLHNHQRIHTGEKPFSCESCGKCFRQRVSYLVHRRIHTGVMPYKCTACEKSFRYKVSQRTHKCTAQPPGTVIRQSGDLVQKLIQNHIETAKETVENNNNGMTQPNEDEKFNTMYGSEAMMLRNENKFNQSIGMMDLDNTLKSCRSKKMNINENFSDEEKTNILDEIVNQSLLKMNFANSGGTSSSSVYQDSNVTDLYSMMSPQHTAMHEENSLPSPSDKLKELKLSSPNENGIENILSEGLYEKNDGMNDLFQNDQSDKLNGGFSKIMTGYPDCGSMNFQNALYDQTYNT